MKENIEDVLLEAAKYFDDESFDGLLVFIKSKGDKECIVTTDGKLIKKEFI